MKQSYDVKEKKLLLDRREHTSFHLEFDYANLISEALKCIHVILGIIL